MIFISYSIKMLEEGQPLPAQIPAPPPSAFSRGIAYLTTLVIGFAATYMFYTFYVADDLSLKRDSEFETLANCIYLAVFLTAGTSVSKFEGKSILSRAVTTLHCVLSLIVRVFIITLPLPVGQ